MGKVCVINAYVLAAWAAGLMAAAYTLNYARWAWRRGQRLGAVGLTALALLSALAPLVTRRPW